MRWVAIAAALAAGCGARGDAATATPMTAAARVEAVTTGPIAERTVLTGELRPGAQLELIAPKTEGWNLTIRWLADDGAVVKRGDRVLEFDNSSVVGGLEQKKLAARDAATQFASANELARMTVAEKDFEVRQRQLALDKATLLAAVPEDLLDKRTSQERKLAQLKAEVSLAGAQRDLAAERDKATLDARVKQIELDKAKRALETADKTLGDLVLTSPADGVIGIADHPWEGRRFVPGDVVRPGMTIVTLPELSKPMEVRAELSDVDDGRVAIGQVGTCTLDAFPAEALPCTVTDLAPVARAKSRQSLRRGFAVKLSVAMTNPERMRPGMSVRVEMPGKPSGDVVRVPRGAVVWGDAPAVVMAGGERRAIALGACDAQRCAVTRGLAAGDRVQVGGGS